MKTFNRCIFTLLALGCSLVGMSGVDVDGPKKAALLLVADEETYGLGVFRWDRTIPLVHLIEKSGYTVHVRAASTWTDAQSEMRTFKRESIDLLLLGGHGTEKSISFGTDRLDMNSAFESTTFNLLKKGANTYLLSCSTGGLSDGIASKLARMSNRPVIAPLFSILNIFKLTDAQDYSEIPKLRYGAWWPDFDCPARKFTCKDGVSQNEPFDFYSEADRNEAVVDLKALFTYNDAPEEVALAIDPDTLSEKVKTMLPGVLFGKDRISLAVDIIRKYPELGNCMLPRISDLFHCYFELSLRRKCQPVLEIENEYLRLACEIAYSRSPIVISGMKRTFISILNSGYYELGRMILFHSNKLAKDTAPLTGDTPLHAIVSNESFLAAKDYLLQKYPHLVLNGNEDRIAREEQANLIKELLEAGAEYKAQDTAGRTPAQLAELNGFKEAQKVLSDWEERNNPRVSPQRYEPIDWFNW